MQGFRENIWQVFEFQTNEELQMLRQDHAEGNNEYYFFVHVCCCGVVCLLCTRECVNYYFCVMMYVDGRSRDAPPQRLSTLQKACVHAIGQRNSLSVRET